MEELCDGQLLFYLNNDILIHYMCERWGLMDKCLFNKIIKQYLTDRGFEKTASNDYAISSRDDVAKFILRAPDQTHGFLLGVQFADYGEYTGTFAKAVMKNFLYESMLCFAKSRDYSQQDILDALGTVWNGIQPYLQGGKAAIRERMEDWAFGASSDRARNEILLCLGSDAIDPYSKDYLLEKVDSMQNGGIITIPLAEYTAHKDFYDQYADYGGMITIEEASQTVRIHFSCAVKIYCSIITKDRSAQTEEQVAVFLGDATERLHATGLFFSNMIPYHKMPDCGEINCLFWSRVPLRQIQQVFADSWQADVADYRQNVIHCPSTLFLWIST